jgi:hypothetical protein
MKVEGFNQCKTEENKGKKRALGGHNLLWDGEKTFFSEGAGYMHFFRLEQEKITSGRQK